MPLADVLAELRQDLRLATRMLRKQAGLTVTVVLTLALGIGANGAIFALVDTVLLRELPLPDSERLMMIRERTATSEEASVSPANMVDWQRRSRSFVRPASGNAAALVPSVRAAIARVDREQLVSVRDVLTLEEIGREATSGYRFRAILVVAFAGLALLLAMVGLFGVIGYSVQRNWREYGVRMALGATVGDVVRLIARGAARLVVPGALAGAGLALAMGQLLGAMLFGIRSFDPETLTAVFIVLVATAAVAIAGRAWRATRLDPAGALRID